MLKRLHVFTVKEMKNSLKLVDVQLVDETESLEKRNIVVFDKELSFGTRDTLTLDGKQNNNVTQQRLVYGSHDSSEFTFVDVVHGLIHWG